jgi:hypothetical protein
MMRMLAALLTIMATGASHSVAGASPPPPPPPPPRSDGAGNTVFAGHHQYIAPEGTQRVCGREVEFCAVMRPEADGARTIYVSEGGSAERRVASLPPLPPLPPPGANFYSLSTRIIRESTGAWIIEVARQDYPEDARGFASARSEILFRLAPGSSEAVKILDVPEAGAVATRYCRGGNRRGPPPLGCVIHHTVDGVLAFDFDNPAGPPRFVLRARATIFPGRPVPPSPTRVMTRERDSDPSCTYRRVFTLDGATGRYAPDAPLPDCARYFELDRWREWAIDDLPRRREATERN